MKVVKYVVRDLIRLFLPSDIYIKFRFLLTHGYACDLNTPRTWNEKIQFRKLNQNPNKLSKYVDKYTVRDFVSNSIGEQYLIPLLGVYNYITPRDFDDLPNEFVIKSSHGGGGEHVKIIRDKSKENIPLLCSRFNSYMTKKFGSKIDEPFYDVEPPRILIEELMLDDDGNLPSDFKCHIFNGGSDKIFIQVDKGRFVDHCRSIYDIDGNVQPFSIQPKYNAIEQGYVFPNEFDELIALAKILSSKFNYVRVDMYIIKGRVYFGELTFCHGSGWERVSSKKYDYLLGSYWNIDDEVRIN